MLAYVLNEWILFTAFCSRFSKLQCLDVIFDAKDIWPHQCWCGQLLDWVPVDNDIIDWCRSIGPVLLKNFTETYGFQADNPQLNWNFKEYWISYVKLPVETAILLTKISWSVDVVDRGRLPLAMFSFCETITNFCSAAQASARGPGCFSRKVL